MRDLSSDYAKYSTKLSNNSNPNYDYTMSADGTTTIHNYSTANPGNGSLSINQCKKSYCIDDWIGFLDTAPEFLNTNLLGSVEIHITFQSANVCMVSDGGPVPDYTFKDMVAWCDTIHFKDQAYLNELDSIVNTPEGLVIPYKNYRTYLGAVLTNSKDCTTRITESTQSLDKIITTFIPNDRNTAGPFVFDTKQSKYFTRNGLGIGFNETDRTKSGTIQYEINSQDISNPLSFVEMYEETVKAFELDRENLKNSNTVMRDMIFYEKYFFVSAISTSHLNGPKETKNIISGIDTGATSLNIAVKTKNGKTPDAAQGGQMMIITEMTSLLRIGAGRQISTMF